MVHATGPPVGQQPGSGTNPITVILSTGLAAAAIRPERTKRPDLTDKRTKLELVGAVLQAGQRVALFRRWPCVPDGKLIAYFGSPPKPTRKSRLSLHGNPCRIDPLYGNSRR